jgi:hypothetical protein
MGKLRAASDDEVAHESAVLGTLSRDPELRAVLPETRGFCAGAVRIQVMRYVVGQSFDALLRRMALSDWTSAMEQILASMSRVAARAEALLPGKFPNSAPVDLFEATRPGLDVLRAVGAEGDLVSELAACLRAAGPVQPALQHGDLCPVNIVRDRRSWWILDFGHFGRDPIPMLDAYHLVRTCSARRAKRRGRDRASGTWLELMASDSPLATKGRETLRGALERHGLTPSQGVAALASYVVLISARLISRGSFFYESFLREALGLASELRRGVPLAARLFGISD